MHNVKRPIISNKIEGYQKSTNQKKPGNIDNFSAEFQKAFKEELMPILLKLYHEIEKKRTFPNSFHETSIMLILKQTKTHQGIKNSDK